MNPLLPRPDLSQSLKDAGFVYREPTEDMKNHPKYKFAKDFLDKQISIDLTPKVSQKGMIEVKLENDSETCEDKK
jgi:hypothetical protein